MTRIPRLVGVVCLGALLALGGCSSTDGTGADDAGRDGASASPPAAGDDERQRQFVECLREQGVDVADPQPGQPLELDKANDPATRDALRACREFAPAASNREKAEVDLGQQREYAACMRANGLSDFPDPDPDAGLLIPKSMVNSPEFQRADGECGALMAKPGAPKK
jgi:hypothetical protein